MAFKITDKNQLIEKMLNYCGQQATYRQEKDGTVVVSRPTVEWKILEEIENPIPLETEEVFKLVPYYKLYYKKDNEWIEIKRNMVYE